MRLWLLTPGTGTFCCGTSLRDGWLAKALRDLGHEAVLAPLYLPLVLEDAVTDEPVRLGGVGVWLQQHAGICRHLPRWLDAVLDGPWLLRLAARAARLTDERKLGAMTLSLLRGAAGRQARAIARLAAWAARRPRPDAILLSNALLCGLAAPLGRATAAPILVTLQGEATFLDALPAPHAEACWRELRERARDVSGFVAVSEAYAGVARERLGLDATRVRVVHNGLDVDGWRQEPTPLAQRRPKTVGFLARLCSEKGLPLLVDAFAELAARGRVEHVRLRAGGVLLPRDRALVAQCRARLSARGLGDRFDVVPNLTKAEKCRFLGTLSVLSVPASRHEAFGLYVLEALAAGTPVVQPRHGAFPELLAATGGGRLCAPDDPHALALALEELLLDEPEAQRLAQRGRRTVLERFHAPRMAAEVAEACAAAAAAWRA